jgi:hypothetical protein
VVSVKDITGGECDFIKKIYERKGYWIYKIGQ